MSPLASLLLQAAMSLLLLVQANPNLNASLRTQAIIVARQAIQIATGQTGTRLATPPTSQAPSVTVLSPNGGETWAQNSTHTIRWTPNSSISSVDIFLKQWIAPCTGNACTDRYPASFQIAHTVPNNGSYSWTIGSLPPYNTVPQGQFVVVLSTGSDPGLLLDASDAPFTIVAPSY